MFLGENVMVFGHPSFSLPWLLGDGHQVQLGLVTDVMTLTTCEAMQWQPL